MSAVSGIDILSIKTPLPNQDFVVVGLNGGEMLSRPFSYAIDMTYGKNFIEPNTLLDKKVTVTLGDVDEGGRYFNGVVSGVKQIPEADGGLWHYRLTLVPALWFLGQTKASRFYHSKSVPDIVKGILGDFSITFDDKLQGTYTSRDYTVQYNESYLYFIQRIMEDEGIFYFFTHTDTEHTMVLADQKSAFPSLGSFEIGATSDSLFDLATWNREDMTALGEVKVGDYNPETDTLDLDSVTGTTATVLKASNASKRTHYSWPAVRGKSGDAATRAKWHMEAAEAASELYEGTGYVMSFVAGGKITISNDPTGSSSSFVLRSVSYNVVDHADTQSGRGASSVQMQCTAFLIDKQWREMPAFAAPVMAGVFTAKVIGTSGEEIYVDDLGRIKVWFPWDEKSDITSDNTLWVRVMQPWGGVGWGHQFIPRVGMEVIVAFLEGDVNRPLVVGSVFNNQMPPIFAPADKNKSGFRTRSTKGGGSDNYHELSFDDTKGSEMVLLHSEKDYQTEVENDQTILVDHDRMKTVKNDETDKIDGKQTITVKKDRTLTVTDGDMKTAVSQGNHSITVDTGNHSMKVSTGNHSTEVSTGNVSTKVDMGNVDTKISTGNETLKLDLGAISHEAMQSITLKVGPNSITIDPSGITLKGVMVQIQGTAMTGIKGPIVQVNADGMLMMSGGITMIN